MQLSMTTDFISDRGPIREPLRLTALAGFTHIHWCHHWNDDFVYTDPEIDEVAQALADYGLQLLDTHASASTRGEKCWYDTDENRRRAGVKLVENRVEFTHRLGGDCVVLHPPSVGQPDEQLQAQLAAMNRSLDELDSFCRDRGIRIALENGLGAGEPNYELVLIPTMETRPAEYVGFCYDTGHHNITPRSAREELMRRRDAQRDQLAERLCASHVHDNNGFEDEHRVPFTRVVDWDSVAAFLRRARYAKPLNLEVSSATRSEGTVEDFVRDARQRADRLARLVTGG